MKKEIGSIFPIRMDSIRLYDNRSYEFYYSLCREALHEIARVNNRGINNVVLIPAYTCNTVISPFRNSGWKCYYYSVKRDLRVDINSLRELISMLNPSIVVVHPYFGMDLNTEELSFLKELEAENIRVVVDLTQCIFSATDYSFASYIVGSYRKWFPIPDGSFLKCKSETVSIDYPKRENTLFLNEMIDAMYLRGVYFRLGDERIKEVSIKLSKKADQIAENKIVPHRMSHISQVILDEQDQSNCSRVRIKNYNCLYNGIKDCENISKVLRSYERLTTAPLYFPVFVKKRDQLQRALAMESVYAPILWPVEDGDVLINDDVKYIYDHILAIPCDQRYTCEDMGRIVKVVNELSK